MPVRRQRGHCGRRGGGQTLLPSTDRIALVQAPPANAPFVVPNDSCSSLQPLNITTCPPEGAFLRRALRGWRDRGRWDDWGGGGGHAGLVQDQGWTEAQARGRGRGTWGGGGGAAVTAGPRTQFVSPMQRGHAEWIPASEQLRGHSVGVGLNVLHKPWRGVTCTDPWGWRLQHIFLHHLGMQVRFEFNLNSSEFVPNSKSCEFERIRRSHNESCK